MEFSLHSNTQQQNITIKKGLSLTALSLFLHRGNCESVPVAVNSISEIDCTNLVIINVDVPCVSIGVWQLSITDNFGQSLNFKTIINKTKT